MAEPREESRLDIRMRLGLKVVAVLASAVGVAVTLGGLGNTQAAGLLFLLIFVCTSGLTVGQIWTILRDREIKDRDAWDRSFSPEKRVDRIMKMGKAS